MIWLRYIEAAETVSMRIDELSAYRRPTVDRETGTSLRGVLYGHRRTRREIGEIVIGADELSAPLAMAFCEAWWTADRQFIAYSDSLTVPDDGEFIELHLPDGDMPIEYVEGYVDLPSFSFTATPKYPGA